MKRSADAQVEAEWRASFAGFSDDEIDATARARAKGEELKSKVNGHWLFKLTVFIWWMVGASLVGMSPTWGAVIARGQWSGGDMAVAIVIGAISLVIVLAAGFAAPRPYSAGAWSVLLVMSLLSVAVVGFRGLPQDEWVLGIVLAAFGFLVVTLVYLIYVLSAWAVERPIRTWISEAPNANAVWKLSLALEAAVELDHRRIYARAALEVRRGSHDPRSTITLTEHLEGERRRRSHHAFRTLMDASGAVERAIGALDEGRALPFDLPISPEDRKWLHAEGQRRAWALRLAARAVLLEPGNPQGVISTCRRALRAALEGDWFGAPAEDPPEPARRSALVHWLIGGIPISVVVVLALAGVAVSEWVWWTTGSLAVWSVGVALDPQLEQRMGGIRAVRGLGPS